MDFTDCATSWGSQKKTGFSLWVIYLCFHKGNVLLLHLDGISGKFYYAYFLSAKKKKMEPVFQDKNNKPLKNKN